MAERSLKVAQEHIQRVKDSIQRNGFSSQTAFITESGIGRNIVGKFLNGRAIDRLNFIECCEQLGWDWQEIAEKPSKIENNPDFVGREAAITTLNELSRGAKVILIQGAGGVGKTALARNYLGSKFGDKIIEFPIAKETEDISPVEGLSEQSLRSLGEEPGRDFGVSLLRLKENLQTQTMGVLIDNLEPALDRFGRFIEGHRRYLELLRILADPTVKSTTLITSREALGETLDISLYRLPILTLEAWQTYFQNREILCDIQEIDAIWNAYQGNALAMKLLSERIFLDYSGNVTAFWQEQQKMGVLLTIDNLIKEQFDRLEKIDLNAYHLFCRMGCFRYQDVLTVPLEGLFCLLWDVVENQRGQVVNALKSRSLVDVIDGEYQLHPLIREEAINRLRSSEEWETANRQAAEFWTESVKTVETEEEAKRAFEAYYHYKNIEDYKKAGNVIAKERDNPFSKKSILGKTFYRVGKLKFIKKAIEDVIKYPDLDLSYNLALFYNILGDIYWIEGEIKKAIEYHKKSHDTAKNTEVKNKNTALPESESLSYKLHELVGLSFFNRGLCKIDLLEIQGAVCEFQKAISISDNYQYNLNNIVKDASNFVLSFAYSYLQKKEEALEHISKVDFDIQHYEWGQGYRFIFLGMSYKTLNMINQSFEQYQKALNFAEKGDYKQVKAKSLTGLGELYRLQGEYQKAIDEYHLKSIEILERIGAKCDLAEAYFQLALTYQVIDDQPKSQTYFFNKALDLWGPEQIDAPKQIERVKKAMQTIP